MLEIVVFLSATVVRYNGKNCVIESHTNGTHKIVFYDNDWDYIKNQNGRVIPHEGTVTAAVELAKRQVQA